MKRGMGERKIIGERKFMQMGEGWSLNGRALSQEKHGGGLRAQ